MGNEETSRIKEALACIPCSAMRYDEWIEVGMSLHSADMPLDAWEEWSQSDAARYHPGDCAAHWKSFDKASGITIASLFAKAKEYGYRPACAAVPQQEGRPIEYGETVDLGDSVPRIDRAMIDAARCPKCPQGWRPEEDLREYFQTLYEPGDYVSYCPNSFEGQDGKLHPGNRVYGYTASQLMAKLEASRDVKAVTGDYNEACGVWINPNPVDGQGAKKANIAAYRYVLVESDTQTLDEQYTLMTAKGGLELPIAALVHSGGKSLHAIVRVDAASAREYAQRVDRIYQVCEKNGLKVDRADKDPSRLSRMPGVMRNGQPQWLIATNTGRKSYVDWSDYIETIDDDLDNPESLASVWDCMPDLAPPLINGILRQGHKMLIAGPSKAGKSFALIELCIAIAEGLPWISWQCARGRVMYVNLELDQASCFHRFRDVYEAMGIRPASLGNIDIWNLRGQAVPMDKLAPRLIRRARQKGYIAIVIDPIYKVITGDENSAEQMSKFCTYFDSIAKELGCAVIYCHHHSKGGQGQKASVDRSSGSGVFARDPDAIVDLIELPLEEENYKSLEDVQTCIAMAGLIHSSDPACMEEISEDDRMSAAKMRQHARDALRRQMGQREADGLVDEAAEAAEAKARRMTGWRIEMTLREFAKPPQSDIWFDYPIHRADSAGRLKDLQPAGYDDGRRWEPRKPKSEDERLTEQIAKTKERNSAYVTRLSLEFENLVNEEGYVEVKKLAEALGVSYTSTKFRKGIEDLEGTGKYKKEQHYKCRDGYERAVITRVS